MQTMRAAALIALVFLSACDELAANRSAPLPGLRDTTVDGSVDVTDAANLSELMLTVAEPQEAVDYFRNALSREPDRLEFRRGYALSLMRVGRHAEASLVYRRLVADGLATVEDRIGFAESLAHTNAWEEVEQQLALVPDTPGSYRLAMVRAMAADQRSDWAAADAQYDAARKLSPRPATVLNNWGVSRLSRGDNAGAELVFLEAITYDPTLFSAKNNMVISRGLQGKFSLPAIPMTEEERGQLLHNLAVIALRQGKTDVGRGLLEQAVEVYPRHFDAAIQKLAALGGTVTR